MNRAIASLRALGWPALAGMGAVAAAIALLAAAHGLERRTNDVRAVITRMAASPPVSPPMAADSPVGQHVVALPHELQFNQDLSTLFTLARELGIRIAAAEYRAEPKPELRVVVRTVNLRVAEDYPKFKQFIAQLLGAVPHAALQEIQVDRKDTATAHGQFQVKFALIYQSAGAPAADGAGAR